MGSIGLVVREWRGGSKDKNDKKLMRARQRSLATSVKTCLFDGGAGPPDSSSQALSGDMWVGRCTIRCYGMTGCTKRVNMCTLNEAMCHILAVTWAEL